MTVGNIATSTIVSSQAFKFEDFKVHSFPPCGQCALPYIAVEITQFDASKQAHSKRPGLHTSSVLQAMVRLRRMSRRKPVA